MKSHIAILSILLSLVASVAISQPSNWRIKCDDSKCITQVTVANPETEEAVASITFSSLQDSTEILATINLPLGVALDPGTQIVAGETVLPATFKVCLPTGCIAATTLDADMRQAFTDEAAFQIRFFVQSEDAAKAVQIETLGLPEALARLAP